uniref:Gsp_23 putative toxin n=1 Tax=Gemmula speciosa TaxID=439592 RepID=A0A098LXU0_GEMSP
MSFYLKLTLAVLLIGLMTVEATSVNQAERKRFAMKKRTAGKRTTCEEYCDYCREVCTKPSPPSSCPNICWTCQVCSI